jgi:SSS family solute:Na+ symporter
VIPGLIALVTVQGLGAKEGDLTYNKAIPLLMRDLLPNGVLGVAVTGLLASFMAGMAANVSGFNTVFTYDIWQSYVRKDRSDEYYIRIGRLATVGGVLVGIATAFIAAGFNNIMNYIQALFSLFNSPLFGTFIVGMFWKRMTPKAGFWSLVLGSAASLTLYLLHLSDVVKFRSDLEESFWGSALAFVVAVVVAFVVTKFTPSKPESELRGLVYGLGGTTTSGEVIVAGAKVWWRNPVVLGAIALIIAAALYIPVW